MVSRKICQYHIFAMIEALVWFVHQVCHGPACEQGGRHRTASYLSAECKVFYKDALLKGIPQNKILEQSRKDVLQWYMVEHKLPTEAAAQAAIEVHAIQQQCGCYCHSLLLNLTSTANNHRQPSQVHLVTCS